MADTYKIVKAADLDAIDSGLTAIATALREKLGDNTLTFVFPSGYTEAIAQLTFTNSEPEPTPTGEE